MARFLLNLRDHRNRSEDVTYLMALSDSKGAMTTRPVSTLNFMPDTSDSMAGSMNYMDDDVFDEDDDETVCEHVGTIDKQVWLDAQSRQLHGVLVLAEKGASWV